MTPRRFGTPGEQAPLGTAAPQAVTGCRPKCSPRPVRSSRQDPCQRTLALLRYVELAIPSGEYPPDAIVSTSFGSGGVDCA